MLRLLKETQQRGEKVVEEFLGFEYNAPPEGMSAQKRSPVLSPRLTRARKSRIRKGGGAQENEELDPMK